MGHGLEQVCSPVKSQNGEIQSTNVRHSVQYLINSEIYPLRLRAIGGSIAMTVHFANQYGNSKAVPSMFLDLTTYGTMFFFVAMTVIGLVWVWYVHAFYHTCPLLLRKRLLLLTLEQGLYPRTLRPQSRSRRRHFRPPVVQDWKVWR